MAPMLPAHDERASHPQVACGGVGAARALFANCQRLLTVALPRGLRSRRN